MFNATPAVEDIIQRYSDVFKDELDELRNYTVSLRVDPNSKPIFCEARHVIRRKDWFCDTVAPVSISMSPHLSLMPTNTIKGSIFFREMRKSLCTETVSPEVIECVLSSCSSLSTLCVWRFLVPLVPFLFRQVAEMWPVW